MSWLNGFIRNQSQSLLENKRHAMLQAMILALLPYTAWLSVTVVALVTLRKGWRDGALLLALAMMAYLALALYSTTPIMALLNTLLVFVPTYLAACTLRSTASWRAVAGVYFLQVTVIVLLLQWLMPEFIVAQFLFLQAALSEIQGEKALLALINNKAGFNQTVIASYLLGLQAVGVVFSAALSLMLARSIQSKLFYPGEFKREMLAFRGDRMAFFLMLCVFILANQQNITAITVLPVLVFYFLLTGLSLSFNVLAKQRPLSSMLILIASLLVLPFIMLPVYVIFGSLDSLFNLRLYLPSDAGKTI